MHFPTDRQPPAGYGECTIFSSIGAQLMQHQRQVQGCLRLKRYRRPGTGNAVVIIPNQQNLVEYQRDRKSVVSGKGMSVRVDIGGSSIHKKTNNNKQLMK